MIIIITKLEEYYNREDLPLDLKEGIKLGLEKLRKYFPEKAIDIAHYQAHIFAVILDPRRKLSGLSKML